MLKKSISPECCGHETTKIIKTGLKKEKKKKKKKRNKITAIHSLAVCLYILQDNAHWVDPA